VDERIAAARAQVLADADDRVSELQQQLQAVTEARDRAVADAASKSKVRLIETLFFQLEIMQCNTRPVVWRT
jgi:hypothetical protein